MHELHVVVSGLPGTTKRAKTGDPKGPTLKPTLQSFTSHVGMNGAASHSAPAERLRDNMETTLASWLLKQDPLCSEAEAQTSGAHTRKTKCQTNEARGNLGRVFQTTGSP